MFAIIGIVVVLVCVVGGFMLEGGNVHVLFQPIELLIIGGAAVGSFFIGSPPRVVKTTMRGFIRVFTGKSVGKDKFLDLLAVCHALSTQAKKEGVLSLEQHVNKPENSAIFKKRPSVLANEELKHFLCDNIKVNLFGVPMEPHQFEAMMDLDTASHHAYEELPTGTITTIADSLPGLGIVAAVLGVVLTMDKIDQPPEVLGHSIGAALVGTFLGILMCYGFVGPMAKNLEHQAKENAELLETAKTWLAAFFSGWPADLTVEMARRAIPSDKRPHFEELEKAVRGG